MEDKKPVRLFKWASLEDWVRSLDELADLNDNEIDEIEKQTRPDKKDIYFE